MVLSAWQQRLGFDQHVFIAFFLTTSEFFKVALSRKWICAITLWGSTLGVYTLGVYTLGPTL